MTKTVFLAYCWGLHFSQKHYAFGKKAKQLWPSFTEFFNANPNDYRAFLESDFESIHNMFTDFDRSEDAIRQFVADEAFLSIYEEWGRKLLKQNAFDIILEEGWIKDFHNFLKNMKIIDKDHDTFLFSPELFSHLVIQDQRDSIITKQQRNIRQEACRLKKVSTRNKKLNDKMDTIKKEADKKVEEANKEKELVSGASSVFESVHERDQEQITSLTEDLEKMQKRFSDFEKMFSGHNVEDISRQIERLTEENRLLHASKLEAECIICKVEKKLGVNECGHRICADCWTTYTSNMTVQRPCPTCKVKVDQKKFIPVIYYKKN